MDLLQDESHLVVCSDHGLDVIKLRVHLGGER